MSRSSIVVLSDKTDAIDVEELAEEQEWARVSLTRRSHVVMANATWQAGRTRVDYYEDHCAEVRYLLFEGPDAKDLARSVSKEVEHYELESTLARAANTADPGESIRNLGRLSVMAPAEVDPRFMEVWQAKFRHADRSVRRAAIRTAYALGWPEMAALVEQRLERDTAMAAQLEDLRAFLRRK